MSKVRVVQVFKYVFLVVAAVISVFPLVWMLSAATNTSIDVIAGKLLPGTYLLENFQNLLSVSNLGGAMFNSFKNAVMLTLVSLFVCSAAGYAFEIFHDKHKDRLMAVLLLSMMVPFATTMIPLFSMFGQLGLLNTTLGFMLPTISTAFLIFLFRQSARNFPYDIVEAARLEGLGEFEIFCRMFVPIMRPTYVAGITVTFMNAWNNYMWPLIIMQDPKSITMPLLVSNLIAGYTTDYGMLMLAVSISTLPTIVIFLLLQKYFAEGITGSVK